MCFRVTDKIKAWLNLSADMGNFRKIEVKIILQLCLSELIIFVNVYGTEQDILVLLEFLNIK